MLGFRLEAGIPQKRAEKSGEPELPFTRSDRGDICIHRNHPLVEKLSGSDFCSKLGVECGLGKIAVQSTPEESI
jgi:hypothetical protein